MTTFTITDKSYQKKLTEYRALIAKGCKKGLTELERDRIEWLADWLTDEDILDS